MLGYLLLDTGQFEEADELYELAHRRAADRVQVVVGRRLGDDVLGLPLLPVVAQSLARPALRSPQRRPPGLGDRVRDREPQPLTRQPR